MWKNIALTILATCITLIASKSCDSRGENFYNDIGCTPYYSKNCECPDGFNCPNFESKNDSCSFQGRNYKDQEKINGTEICLSCSCSVQDNTSFIACAMPDCAAPEAKENCSVYQGSKDCCVYEEICRKEPIICKVDGVEYKENFFFHPENTCLQCICSEEFDGTFRAPYCTKIRCYAELWSADQVNNRCAPVFEKTAAPCCPSNFVCDNGILSLKFLSKGKPTKENMCKLGNRKFYKNDEFQVEYMDRNGLQQNTTCGCDLPPYPTCFN